MIISHKYRYVFVEVPHTGSHSIAQQLLKHYAGEQIVRHHANITLFLAKASREERAYFKFATVRNPLDTAVTDYTKMLGNHKDQFTNPKALIENGGFITKQHLAEYRFIHENNADFPAFFKRFRNKLYNNWFLVGEQHFDYVIRFESLQDSFAEVLKRIGIEQQEPLPHVNPTKLKRKRFVEFYTPDIYPDAARAYGPFLNKWGYGLPPEWGPVAIPKSAELQFRLLDGVGRIASNHFALDPDHPFIARTKAFVDRLTSRR